LTPKAIEQNHANNLPYVIRFKLENKDVSFEDMTSGLHTSCPAKVEGDFVIIKSDKFPTYHFANVVDDHLMQITHVLRGLEWQLSTAKHILLYEAFGWKHPVYAHLPLICNMDGTKISKRQNDIDVLSFRERGYLPEALLTYLSTIGGGGRTNVAESEAFFNDFHQVRQNLVNNFDETKMINRPVKLNQELLDNMNRRFMKSKFNTDDLKGKMIDELRNSLK
jgi:glutamyl-tRNA synthetase